jgi:hypothetical protein
MPTSAGHDRQPGRDADTLRRKRSLVQSQYRPPDLPSSEPKREGPGNFERGDAVDRQELVAYDGRARARPEDQADADRLGGLFICGIELRVVMHFSNRQNALVATHQRTRPAGDESLSGQQRDEHLRAGASPACHRVPSGSGLVTGDRDYG